jgi:hypothetical protein
MHYIPEEGIIQLALLPQLRNLQQLPLLFVLNATELYIYRLRNYKDLETFIDEVSAVTDKKTLMQIYNLATSEPYSFLYVNLRAKKVSEMFHIRFDKKIEIEDD